MDPKISPTEKVRKFFKRARYSYRSLPDKKQYVEFFTAILSVPVLLTVIILNVNNLQGKKAEEAKTTNTTSPIIVTVPVGNNSNTSNQPTAQACKKGIGPISIDSPEANEVVTDNPVQIAINYDQGDYCSVVWSYSINGGRFSEYSSNSIALYNPPSGNIKFQLKVKSVVTGEEKLLNRNFVYQGAAVTPTSPVASSSAN